MSETLSVCKQFEISYAHHLQDYPGKCKQLHGHNAIVELEFTQHVSAFHELMKSESGHYAISGMIHDFTEIKNEVEAEIKDVLDHQCLNDLPGFHKKRPTAENLCFLIVDIVLQSTPPRFQNLSRVRVWEDRDSFAEWRRA